MPYKGGGTCISMEILGKGMTTMVEVKLNPNVTSWTLRWIIVVSLILPLVVAYN